VPKNTALLRRIGETGELSPAIRNRRREAAGGHTVWMGQLWQESCQKKPVMPERRCAHFSKWTVVLNTPFRSQDAHGF